MNAALTAYIADHPSIKDTLHDPIYSHPGGRRGLLASREILKSAGFSGEVLVGLLAHLAQDVWWEENVRSRLPSMDLAERRRIETCWCIRHLRSSEERKDMAGMILSLAYARETDLDALLWKLTSALGSRSSSIRRYLDMLASHFEGELFERRECDIIEESFDPISLVEFVLRSQLG